MTGFKGRDFQIEIAGSASPTVWTKVAGLRGTSVTINNAPVDVTNKGSEGYRELLVDGGVQSFDIAGDGVYLAGGADRQLFISALQRTTIYARINSMGSGEKFTAVWVVASYVRQGGHDTAETFTLSLQSTGKIIYQSS